MVQSRPNAECTQKNAAQSLVSSGITEGSPFRSRRVLFPLCLQFLVPCEPACLPSMKGDARASSLEMMSWLRAVLSVACRILVLMSKGV